MSVTAHALFAWKKIFHQAGGLFVVLEGKDTGSGLGYRGYAVGVVV